jgi:hypothetical protein
MDQHSGIPNALKGNEGFLVDRHSSEAIAFQGWDIPYDSYASTASSREGSCAAMIFVRDMLKAPLGTMTIERALADLTRVELELELGKSGFGVFHK